MKQLHVYVPRQLDKCGEYPDCGCRKICDDELRRHASHGAFIGWIETVLIVSLVALGLIALFGGDRIAATIAGSF
ncbi:MAG TPA: hypothetical protein VMF90_06005 [Rhizobiaceae bacterium]|nr:hypothetical protein [Rhizobiaceae bacterium]